MNLSCHVQVNNQHLAVLNTGRKRKPCCANLVICQNARRVGSETEKLHTYLFVCTAQNQAGTKYEVEKNIKHIYKMFVNEGKATICLIEPPHDIVVSKADPVQLKGFLRLLHLALQKSIEVKLLPPPTKFQKPPPEKLVVLGRENYPKEFPLSLKTVSLNSCTLKRVDPRVFKLQHLHTLDLQCNKITSLPAEIKHLCLSYLNLAQNLIEIFPKEICEGNLRKCLKHLNIEKNLIENIPSVFTSLEQLSVLNIGYNKVLYFPPNIGNMENLKVVLASTNRIKCLPASFKRLKLYTFDLTDNPLNEKSDLSSPVFQLLSLKELAANSIKKYRIPYGPGIIPSVLINYLDNNYAECICGNMTFTMSATTVTDMDIRSFAETTYFTEDKRTVPVKICCCSKKCWQRITRAHHDFH